MGETIQSFVDKIKTQGIQAGQKQAEQLLAETRAQAEQLLSDANQEKGNILTSARQEAENILARAETELKLAARDAAFRLRDALGRAVHSVLAQGAKAKLEDPEFIGKVLHEIITQYSKSDLAGKEAIRINLPQEMREKLVDWAMKHLNQKAQDGSHMGIDLRGALSQAGFEYNVSGATVEVTLESVVEVLADMVGPKLREVLSQALVEESE